MTIMVITVILGDLQGLLFKGHYIHFYEKNKLTIIFISAQVNNLEMHNNKWEKVANNFKV